MTTSQELRLLRVEYKLWKMENGGVVNHFYENRIHELEIIKSIDEAAYETWITENQRQTLWQRILRLFKRDSLYDECFRMEFEKSLLRK